MPHSCRYAMVLVIRDECEIPLQTEQIQNIYQTNIPTYFLIKLDLYLLFIYLGKNISQNSIWIEYFIKYNVGIVITVNL